MLVDSNGALNLVTGWLKALEIDVSEMSRIGEWKVERYNYQRGKPSHLWWVNCVDPRGRGTNLAWVVADGTARLPGRIRIPNTSFSRRAGIAIPNAKELMRVPEAVPQCSPLAAHLNVVAARANLR